MSSRRSRSQQGRCENTTWHEDCNLLSLTASSHWSCLWWLRVLIEQIVIPFVHLKSQHSNTLLLSLWNTSVLLLSLGENLVTAQPCSTVCHHCHWRSYCCFNEHQVFRLCFSLHLNQIHIWMWFSLKHCVFSPPESPGPVIEEFSAIARWNALLHNFLLQISSVQWYGDRESMAWHIK